MNRINGNIYNNQRNNGEECIPKKQKKKTLKSKIRRFFTLIFFILAIIIALFIVKVNKNGGGIKGVITTILGYNIEDINNLETINVLLLGVSEDLESRLTDTIVVCSYNPKNQSVSMISIPRDTFIGKNKVNAKGTDKINYLYSKSPDKLLKTVSEIIGINVNYYAVVSNNALINIVDDIGGIIYNVPIDMDYDDSTQDLHIHLKRGLQKIDGEKAEQLLRFRHNNDGTSYPSSYGDNDYGRMKTQREFMKETLKQTLKVGNIKNCKKIFNSVINNIDTNLDMRVLKPYIPTIIGFDVENIISNQLPGESEKYNNLWFFIYDKNKTNNLINDIFKNK